VEQKRAKSDAVPVDPGVSARVLLGLAGYLREIGRNPLTLLHDAGVDPSQLLTRNAWIGRRDMYAIWRRAEEITGDPSLGLSTIAFADPRMVSVLQYESEYLFLQLIATADTVRDALTRAEEFYSCTYGAARFTLIHEKDVSRVVLHLPDEAHAPRSFVEFCIAVPVRTLVASTSGDFAPKEIRFRHPAPPSPGAYEKTLGGPVRFGAEESGFVVSRPSLGTKLRSSNPILASQLVRSARLLLEERSRVESLADRVRIEIENELPHGNPAAERIAKKIGLSVRHLSRRLGEEGTSHKDLLDQVRAKLADRYLREEGKALEDIATLLGYSDASALRRAFKRWFGKSPSEHREDPGEEVPSQSATVRNEGEEEGPTRVPSTLRATLRVEQGKELDKLYRVRGAFTLIGRRGADIQIDDERVSRSHATISYHDRTREFRIHDMKSANGTLLNGSRVTEYALRNGDKLVIGDTVLSFEVVTVAGDDDD
jgi:AraC-like DNA-binding protein